MNTSLLPPEVELTIPPLYASEETPRDEVKAVAKYFSPYSDWTWFVVEGSREGDDFIFFGLVYGFEKEWGYFSLSELESAKKGDLPLVERDLFFGPTMISELEKKYDKLFR